MQYAELFTVSGEWLLANALNVAVALLVAVAGWHLSRFLSSHARNLLPRTRRIDATIAPLLAWVVRYGILVITTIIVLGQFGVQTASILAVLGAAGLAVALALQGTLSNLAAGVMLVWLRPFNVGEAVDCDGISGTVVEIGLFGTRLRTYDGLFVFAPNSRLWAARIINYSRERTRMVETKVGIAYGADIAAARAALLEVARDERVLSDPEPTVFVDSLGDTAVVLCLRVWAKGGDWWAVTIDFRERIKTAFDAAGIEIAHRRSELYLREVAPETGPPAGPPPKPRRGSAARS
jgi:small conductance mechanosensitive channel